MRRFYKTLRRLNDKLCPEYPVYVYFTTSKILPKCYGDCSFTGKSFSIRIVNTSWDTSLFVLLHEFGHVLSWFDKECEDDWHGEKFGIAYSKVWKVYSGEA